MYLDEETYEEIKGEVAHYLVQCGMSYPLNVDEFIRKMNMEVIPYSALGHRAYFAAMEASKDGFLCEKNCAYAYVFFNDSKIDERQDVSKLHEIGHLVLDHNSTPNKSDDVKEAEAKFFAKYAKAPMPLIHLLPIVTTEIIQKAFGLSREAAKYALDNYRKWLDRFNGTYTDYEQKILSLKRDGLNAYIEELKIQKERSSVRYQRAEGQRYEPNLARKPRGQAVPLQDCNSTVVQRNLYEVRQMAGP
ncbi:MAG: ImmA/IrrE family metallo-endopeptidase [Fibrobacter sp.]|nr:ImmA/IrrE family metallo-endopeptidase [Fibrobacter sp.]